MEPTGSMAGRTSAALVASITRELSEADILLRKVTPVGSEAKPLVKLRLQHHNLAKYLASGMSPAEAGMLTGYSPSRISILQADPSFKELLSHYVTHQTAIYSDLHQRMKVLATDAISEIESRLENSPEQFENKELIAIAKTANDRGGNNPVNRSVSTSVVLTGEDLKAIKDEVRVLENGQAKALEDNQRSLTIESHAEPAGILLEEQSAEGLPSEGENV